MGARGFGTTYGVDANDYLDAGNIPYSSKQSLFAWVWRNGSGQFTIMRHGINIFAAGPMEIFYYDPTQGAYSYVHDHFPLRTENG